jgi:predicted PurR-regulated permease PerM
MTDASRTVARARRPEVRLSLRSALAIVFAIAATVLALEVAVDAERVVAWALSALMVAALVHPIVGFVERYMRRGLAVLVVFVLVLGSLGFVTYRIVREVSDQTGRLRETAPERAAELEADSDLLQEVEFTRRVERLVDSIPERLRGGTTAEAVRSAANRGLAFVVGVVLTLFFVLYGPVLVRGAYGQIRDPDRRRRVEAITRSGARRGFDYARWQLAIAVAEGVLAYVIATAADVPGPAALAVWVGLWSLIPVFGLFIGAVPVVLFAGATSTTTAVLVALAFAVIGIGAILASREAARRTVRVGSFLTALALFTGLELYGFSGAVLLLLLTILVVAMIGEIGPGEVAETVIAPLAGVDEPEANA